jgi:hypothetical protein
MIFEVPTRCRPRLAPHRESKPEAYQKEEHSHPFADQTVIRRWRGTSRTISPRIHWEPSD